MTGMNRHTGKRLSGKEHLAQSIHDLFSTSLRERVMRSAYGSEFMSLIDAPLNAETTAKITAAFVAAIADWEPRVKVVKCVPQRTSAAELAAGRLRVNLVLRTSESELEAFSVNF